MTQFTAPTERRTMKGPVDYKNVDELRRMMTGNGKILGRKRLSLSAGEQKQVTQAIKRARHLALLPFTNAAN
jgi:small subunit ribosomal protein S18